MFPVDVILLYCSFVRLDGLRWESEGRREILDILIK